MYQVPTEFQVRLHHCRPRFKNNIENVLFYVANEIEAIGELPNKEFAERLNQSIKLFPGNGTSANKTINNWRTEISSLLGLIELTDNETSKPSNMAKTLCKNEDLIEFFRYFCLKFQYPGGHLKADKALEMLIKGVKFKPVGYILELLLFAKTNQEERLGLSKEEVTHCIFNDLRVARDNRSVEDTLRLIMKNRSKHIEYDSGGDTVRYAGDILDYMVLANLIDKKPNGKYYLRTIELEVVKAIINNKDYFPEYEQFYNNEEVTVKDISATNKSWYKYVNANLEANAFQADIFSIADSLEEDESNEGSFIAELINSIRRKQASQGKVRTKDIGDAGEALTIQHEQIRLTNMDRADLAKKVKKLPEEFAMGYDIISHEGETENKRCIEVKTTISRNKLSIQRFHMTPNEWEAAKTFKDAYYIYRLMITGDNVSLFIMQDPVGLYKKDVIDMTPRHGVDVTYNEKAGFYEEVLS